MGKYIKKPIVIEAITFDELLNHGIKDGTIKYKGHDIVRVSDKCFRIETLEGYHDMTDKDMLIVGIRGEIYPCKIDIFNETYEFFSL